MDRNLLDWKASGEYFRYNSHNIFYKDTQEETKPCLVCLHGFPSSSWDWQTVWPKLSMKYRVIAFDMLGFGFSDKPKNHIYSIKEQAQILISLLDSKQITHYHLIAHDFATLVAQELLGESYNESKYPKINSLFAMSGSIFPELSNPRLIQKLLISSMGFLISRIFTQSMFNRNLSRVFTQNSIPEGLALKQYWTLMTFKQGHKLLHKLNFFLKDRAKYGELWKQNWQQTQTPICYIAGADDPMYGQDGIAKLKAISNQKDIHAIPKIGHFPHVEAPSEFLKLFNQFMEKA